jgi:hypothetical protein
MIGYESAVINSQLVNVAPLQGYNPLVMGRAYTPVGAWPRQGVYNVPPVLPAGSLQQSMAPAAYGGTVSTGVLPTMADDQGSPFSVKSSPLWWGLGFLILGVLMLQHIHYK